MNDTVGRTRCANQNVSIFSDGLPEGPETFAISMVFDSSSYDADPAAASVNIDDEDDGKSAVIMIKCLLVMLTLPMERPYIGIAYSPYCG